ncbi:helix-turn-helix domain-containing protein [Algoriphagus litoralis]|uniref:helix-turn-helix domain-containing protein n=1 Tax=Algoriphagus litoralis TaxID=2202829 RepID=UPI000DBAD860|nr:helix-turn-helix transcriptional regulator [Algoriphagus litoralis]
MSELKKGILASLLSEIDPLEQAKTDAKMEIAAKIAQAMEAKKWKKKDLLNVVGKDNPSIITKWLSGTHNFTIDTLVELEKALSISLINREVKNPVMIEYHLHISQEIDKPEKNSYFNEIMTSTFVSEQSKSVQFQA